MKPDAWCAYDLSELHECFPLWWKLVLGKALWAFLGHPVSAKCWTMVLVRSPMTDNPPYLTQLASWALWCGDLVLLEFCSPRVLSKVQKLKPWGWWGRSIHSSRTHRPKASQGALWQSSRHTRMETQLSSPGGLMPLYATLMRTV